MQLTEVPCSRLAEALAGYHDGMLEADTLCRRYRGKTKPDVEQFGRKMVPIRAYLKQHNLRPPGFAAPSLNFII